MRNMSFALTIEQFNDGSKTVTRRQGWAFLKPGDKVMGVEKGMGLKKGEKVKKLHALRVTSVMRCRIDMITQQDVVREGFPGRSPEWFIDMYCKANRCDPADDCTRIQFEHLFEVTG